MAFLFPIPCSSWVSNILYFHISYLQETLSSLFSLLDSGFCLNINTLNISSSSPVWQKMNQFQLIKFFSEQLDDFAQCGGANVETDFSAACWTLPGKVGVWSLKWFGGLWNGGREPCPFLLLSKFSREISLSLVGAEVSFLKEVQLLQSYPFLALEAAPPAAQTLPCFVLLFITYSLTSNLLKTCLHEVLPLSLWNQVPPC